MLVKKVEKVKVILDKKDIKNFKKTSRNFNRKYNEALSKLLTDKYSLPTRQEWDSLMSEINKLRKEIKNLKSTWIT